MDFGKPKAAAQAGDFLMTDDCIVTKIVSINVTTNADKLHHHEPALSSVPPHYVSYQWQYLSGAGKSLGPIVE